MTLEFIGTTLPSGTRDNPEYAGIIDALKNAEGQWAEIPLGTADDAEEKTVKNSVSRLNAALKARGAKTATRNAGTTLYAQWELPAVELETVDGPYDNETE